MNRPLVSLLTAALIALLASAADAGTRLSKTTYTKATTAALKNAASLMIHGAYSKKPEARALSQLSFVRGAKYLKLGPITSSSGGLTQQVTVQTRRSVDGARGSAPLAEVVISVRPVMQAGKVVGYRAYNGAAPANKITINK